MTYLLDSDILSYLLRGQPTPTERLRQAVRGNHTFLLSPVVEHEVTRHLLLTGSDRRLQMMQGMIAHWKRVPLDAESWRLATNLWGQPSSRRASHCGF